MMTACAAAYRATVPIYTGKNLASLIIGRKTLHQFIAQESNYSIKPKKIKT